jgi:3-phytase
LTPGLVDHGGDVRPVLVLLALALAVVTGAAGAQGSEVQATLETEPFFDNDSDDSDADDPAIWVHSQNRALSIVIGTLKNGGLAVFNLDGETIQRLDYADEDARQNNVDLLYDVELGGETRDLAVVTDRGLDDLRVFEIDPAGSSAGRPLSELTEPDPPNVFTGDDEISAYGTAAWKARDGSAYVAISQRHRTALVLVRLVARPEGSVGFERVDSLTLPATFSLGQETWSPCAEADGELPQVEGMVADARRGFLFAAQEDVGIWRIPVAGGAFAQPKLFDRVREFGQPYTRTFDPEAEEFVCEIDESSPSAGSQYLAADAEGLTIYPLPGNGRGYLLASSQGSSTFIVYQLASLRPLGAFSIGEGPTDAVDQSDGAMVVAVPLGPIFAHGLLVTHDGDDEPGEDATNFKFTRWEDVAKPLRLTIDTTTGDPRR